MIKKNNIIITVCIIAASALLGFLIEEGMFLINRSIFLLILDIVLVLIALITIKVNHRTKPLLIVFFSFLVVSLISFFLNYSELSIISYINGLRDFLPYFLFPLIFINMFQSKYRMHLEKYIKVFLYVYLILQIPVSIYQFLIFGAGDSVGGTFGIHGGSGDLSFTIIIATYYLMVLDLNKNRLLTGILKKSYLFIFWIPMFINETKISFLLIFLFFVFMMDFRLQRIINILILVLLLNVSLVIFNNTYNNNSDLKFNSEILYKDYIVDYLISDDDKHTDIPRLQKVVIFVTKSNLQEILFGKGLGQFKGGSTLELTPYANKYQWLLSGSIPTIFLLFVQVGVIGWLIYLFYWILLVLQHVKKNRHSFSVNILFFLNSLFLIMQIYNNSRNLFFSGLLMYLLIYSTSQRSLTRKEFYKLKKISEKSIVKSHV